MVLDGHNKQFPKPEKSIHIRKYKSLLVEHFTSEVNRSCEQRALINSYT